VKKLDESKGYIDLVWKGTILIEVKSRGKIFSRPIFNREKEEISLN
jgi:hypothetical protein